MNGGRILKVSQEEGILYVEIQDPKHTYASRSIKYSLKAYEWLLNHEDMCDIIHFHDFFGIGYYTTLAKYEGIAFLDKIIQIGKQLT